LGGAVEADVDLGCLDGQRDVAGVVAVTEFAVGEDGAGGGNIEGDG